MSVATLVSLSLRQTAAHRPEKLSQTWHFISQATWEPATSAPSRFPQLLMLHSPCSHSHFPIHGCLHCFQYFPDNKATLYLRVRTSCPVGGGELAARNPWRWSHWVEANSCVRQRHLLPRGLCGGHRFPKAPHTLPV